MYDLERIAEDQARFARCVAEAQPYAPLLVKIKLTWRCNLRCVMCNIWRQQRHELLSLDRLRALADELADLGTRKVHLSGGETLLRPDLFDLVAYLSDKGMRVNLTTNGTLLTPERAERLVEAGVRGVSISVDSPDRKVHDRIRGVAGAWKRTVRGIRALRRVVDRHRAKVRLRINTVITRRNYATLDRLAAFAHGEGVDRLTLIPVDDPTGQLRLNKTRIRDFNARVAPVLAEEGVAWELFQTPEEAYPFGRTGRELEYSKLGEYARGLYRRQPCYAPWTHAFITPRGRVHACCMTRGARPLGDLRTQSFREVWEGASYRALRVAIRDGHLYPACHRCDDFLQANRFLHRLADGRGEAFDVRRGR